MLDPVHAIAYGLSALLLIATWLDVTRYTIPNWLNALILLLYPAMLFMVPAGHDIAWGYALLGFLLIFAVGYGLFCLGIFGGGDIKMLCALGLWCGWTPTLLYFLLLTAALGGVLTLGLLGLRLAIEWVITLRKGSLERVPKLLHFRSPLPYGVAIAAAFALMLWNGQIPGLITLAPMSTMFLGLFSQV